MVGLCTDIFVELHVPDFVAAIDFYGKLGFREVRREANYLVLRRGNSIINFYGGSPSVVNHSHFSAFPTNTPRGFGVEIVFPVEEIDSYYEQLKSNVVEIVADLKVRPWGKKDFRIVDPFGFYIRVTERYDMLRQEGI